MKTLSSFNDTKVDSPHVSPIMLFEVVLSGITLYMCDRAFGSGSSRNIFDSQVWEPVVLEWENIKSGDIKYGGHVPNPGGGSILIDNTIPIGGAGSFTSLFSSNTVFYQTIRVYRIYDGASVTADKILLVDSEIEDIEMEQETVRLYYTSSDVTLNKKFSPIFCELDAYPGAEPDDVGKMLPIVYGNARKIPFVGVDTGTLDTLSGQIDDSITSFTVSDATGFPVGGGTVQIDSEQITYSYRSGNLFSGCTRGVNSTTAAAHDKAAVVAEIQTSYIYVISHAVKLISTVYVEHRNTREFVSQSGNYTVYTGQAGDEHGSYPGKAVIEFNTLPTIEKQVNLEIEDTIGVDDTIDVDDPGHGHGSGDVLRAGWTFDTPTGYGGWYIFPGNLCDGSLNEATYLSSQGAYVRAERVMGTGVLDRQPLGVKIWVDITFLDSACNVNVKIVFPVGGGGSLTFSHIFTSTGTQHYPPGSSWFDISDKSANDLASAYIVVTRGGGSPSGSALITEAWMEIQSEPFEDPADVNKTGAALKTGTVELIGNSVADTVIGGRVCADMQGYQADASGNYGTNGSLIERPDYVFKHFLVNHCGWSISDFGTTYTDVAANYSLNNILLAPVLLDRPNILEFMSKMAFQCNSAHFFDEGKHQLVFLADDDTEDKTLEQGRLDSKSVNIRYTPRAEIINRYTATYNKEWVQSGRTDVEDEKSVLQENDSASQSTYGILEGDVIGLNYIRSEAQARLLLQWLLEDTADPKLIVSCKGGDYLEALQKADIIDFTFTAGSELDREFLGLVVSESTKFRILEMDRSQEGQKFIVAKQSSQSISSEYEVYLGNTRWEADQLNGYVSSSWDSGNNRWNFNIAVSGDGGKIRAIGTWADAIRPEKIKITHDHSGPPSLTIYATDGLLYSVASYTSGTEISPNWANRIGIESIQLEVPSADNAVFHVSNIELWSQAPSVTQTTTTTSTTNTQSTTTSSTASTASTTSSSTSTISTTSTTYTGTTTTTTGTTVSTTASTWSTTSSTASTISTTSSTSISTSTSSSTSSTASTIFTSTTSTSSSTSSTASTGIRVYIQIY